MIFNSIYFVFLILYFLILDGNCQISQIINSNNRRPFQEINQQRSIQFIQSPDIIPQVKSPRKQPIKITSDQASRMLGLSFLRGQVLPPGTIIQKRGHSIKVVLPKLETPHKIPIQQKFVPGILPKINRNIPLSTQQVRGPFPGRGRQLLQQNFKGQNVNFQQIPRPNNFRQTNVITQPFTRQQKKQQIPNIPLPRRQLLPVPPPRKQIPLPPKNLNSIFNVENNFIHTNGIQPPAPIIKVPEDKSIGSPPSEVPPNDFVVDELNKSDNFLETARRLALAHRLRIA